MIRAGILGPTGYAGLELINILLRRSDVKIVYLGSRREPQPLISETWPQLRGRLDMRCSSMEPQDLPAMDVAFIALPHTVAMEYVPALMDRGVAVVDLSADYRIKDPAQYAKHYKHDHTDAARLSQAVYGLPELFREEVRKARLVANPGCYPTSIILALAPLLRAGLVELGRPIIVDAKSGISGAGRTPNEKLHYPEANENFRAYKVNEHQHRGEIQQTFDILAGAKTRFCFVPHIVPMDRGILATCYVPLRTPAAAEELCGVFSKFYAGQRFVRFLGADLPETKNVMMNNYCDIGLRVADDTAIVMSAIDNLVKGAAGQAVQNMNILFGLDESLGLL